MHMAGDLSTIFCFPALRSFFYLQDKSIFVFFYEESI